MPVAHVLRALRGETRLLFRDALDFRWWRREAQRTFRAVENYGGAVGYFERARFDPSHCWNA